MKEVVDFFTKGCEEANEVGWAAARFSSLEEQFMTFYRATRLEEIENSSILDVGCGQGDLYAFMSNGGYFNGNYTGIDITPAMIEKAKKKYPKGNFLFGDALSSNLRSDFVLAVGTFNVRFTDKQNEYVKLAMENLFSKAKKALVMTLLSYNGYEEARKYKKLVGYDPAEMLNKAFTLTNCVELDHAYLPHEFCLVLHKRKK